MVLWRNWSTRPTQNRLEKSLRVRISSALFLICNRIKIPFVNLMNLMSRDFALGLLRQGKTGEEILRILDTISNMNTEETENPTEEIEF